MKRNDIFKILSVLLAFLLTINLILDSGLYSSAGEMLTKDEQKVVLEQKLKQVEARLDYLAKNSTQTQEYLDALEKQLDYLKQRYDIIKSECDDVEKRIKSTQNTIENNRNKINDAKGELNSLDDNLVSLKSDFSSTYELYAKRLRAMYISHSQNTWILFLLDSGSITDFLIRLQMFASVTEKDSQLLNSINTQMDKIISTQDSIEDNKTELEKNINALEENEIKLKDDRAELFSREEELNLEKNKIEEEQQKANNLLKKLNDESANYGEYRDITQEEIAQIDAQIADADQKYPNENLTTTTEAYESDTEESTTQSTVKTEYLNLTYPCPSYTQITCGFGEYKGHSGCDFSTKYNENEKIVAAESGTVILVKLLEKSYGHYVVIRHDKTTSGGDVAYTLYAHNNDIIVNEGDYVEKGQQIAYSGTTGNSTGPHCHFEVRIGGSSQANAVNPVKYLPSKE